MYSLDNPKRQISIFKLLLFDIYISIVFLHVGSINKLTVFENSSSAISKRKKENDHCNLIEGVTFDIYAHI